MKLEAKRKIELVATAILEAKRNIGLVATAIVVLLVRGNKFMILATCLIFLFWAFIPNKYFYAESKKYREIKRL